MVILGCAEEDDLVSFDPLSLVDISLLFHQATSQNQYGNWKICDTKYSGDQGRPRCQKCISKYRIGSYDDTHQGPNKWVVKNDFTCRKVTLEPC